MREWTRLLWTCCALLAPSRVALAARKPEVQLALALEQEQEQEQEQELGLAPVALAVA